MKNYTRILYLLFLFWVLSGLVISGCGKKGPPEIIEKSVEKLKSVENLKYRIQDSDVLLQWESNYKQDIDGFEIFMAEQNIKECKGCPVVFKRIDYIPPELNQYKKELKKGYRYFFKVKTVSANNMKSNDSEIVKIEFE